MRVFVAGATGAIGRNLVPKLIEQGHEVIGTYRSAGNAERLSSAGAKPVELDLLDGSAVRAAVFEAKPDAIIHQATALAGAGFSRSLDKTFAGTNRLRTTGTDALLAAARGARVTRFIAQSYAPYRYLRDGGPVKTEADPLDPEAPAGMRETFAAMTYLDDAVTDAGGVSLRYGGFYGPGDEGLAGPVRKRQYPIIGDGAGITPLIHLDDAAAATALALDHDGPAIYNVTDDEPARASEWIPALAQVLGAKPPRHVPAWLARVIVGDGGVQVLTRCRGAANAKAKDELGWTLRYPSWRQGFIAAFGRPDAGAAAA